MASHVNGSSGESLQAGATTSSNGTSTQPSPSLGVKPRLTPKPFSLQRNTTIRSIHAPKTATTAAPTSRNIVPIAPTAEPTTVPKLDSNPDIKPKETATSAGKTTDKSTSHETDKSEPSSVLKATLATPARPSPQQNTPSDSKIHAEAQLTQTKKDEVNQEEKQSPDPSSALAHLGPASQPTEPKTNHLDRLNPTNATQPQAIQRPVVTQQKEGEEQGGETLSSVTSPPLDPKPQDSVSTTSSTASPSANPTSLWGGARKRLSVDLKSKFESSGLSLPSQPATTSTTNTKDGGNKPASSDPDPDPGLTSSVPPDREKDDRQKEGMKEMTGGSSIKRRISLLLDSSSRPEVITRREEPQVISQSNGTGGVKERIKNWAVDTNSETQKTENKPQLLPRDSSKSFESVKPVAAATDLPVAGKTQKKPPVELPVSEAPSAQAVDQPSEVSSAGQPTERPLETSKDAEEKLQESSGQPPDPSADTGTSKSVRQSLEKGSIRRRSVHFGVVERDDGGPPEILGSDSDSEEEEVPGDEAEDKAPVLAIKRQEEEEEEQKRLDVEERRRAEENEKERLKIEEEKKRQEEEERERERQVEEVRQRQREEERERARQKEERLREEEKLREEEMERQREEEWEKERLKEEEKESKRMREEERERERQLEVLWQRQREEERERARQKEERLREEEKLREERERLGKEEMERERQQEEERERERLREEEMERERQREEERERERQQEEERERERLREEERERERLREEEMERERQREQMERERQREERERERQREEERERERLREEERQRERQREEERERERLREEERERLREEERERERQQEEESERLREEERERERQREEERERERLREEERERLREEERERERLREEERERERQREEERERLREEERERERQREEERERERLREEERERLREEERERERLREEERERLREEERERERQRDEERERERLAEEERIKQQEEERERQREEEMREKLREEERARQEEEERERERLLAREKQEEREREERKLVSLQKEEDGDRESALDVAEPDLISFDSEDVPLKTESASVFPSNQSDVTAPGTEQGQSQIEVVYDDFSVRKPTSLIDIPYEDFSVKPLRWGSRAKADVGPVWAGAGYPGVEEVEVLVPLDVNPRKPEVSEPDRGETPDSPEPCPDQESPKESPAEHTSFEKEEEEKEEEEEEEVLEKEEEVAKKEGEEEEHGNQEEQVKSYCTDTEVPDTKALIDSEPDQQYEACEQMSPETESPTPIVDQRPEVSSDDVDVSPLHTEPELPPLPENSTLLLDTRAQRSRADLVKRRSQRTRLPKSGRQTSALPLHTDGPSSPDWRACDSTDGKVVCSKRKESDSEEEQPRPKEVCPPTSQRVPMFPGLNPSALMAQLKKRTAGGGGGGGGGEEKGVEKDGAREERAPPASQLSRSPRSPAHLAGAARVLPPLGGMDGGTASSPSWLKELKSKKRLSQYDSEA
ncbi:182 kDa tankyrase-1-binding protein isoform 1-T2 [Polymixia lowei]